MNPNAVISDYSMDCVGKCEGLGEERPERESPRGGTGVDYARTIYRAIATNRDSVAVYVGDGSRRSSICFRRVLSVSGSGRLYRNNTFY